MSKKMSRSKTVPEALLPLSQGLAVISQQRFTLWGHKLQILQDSCSFHWWLNTIDTKHQIWTKFFSKKRIKTACPLLCYNSAHIWCLVPWVLVTSWSNEKKTYCMLHNFKDLSSIKITNVVKLTLEKMLEIGRLINL